MQKKCILSFVETCTVGKNLNFLTAELDSFWVISVYCDRQFYFSLGVLRPQECNFQVQLVVQLMHQFIESNMDNQKQAFT